MKLSVGSLTSGLEFHGKVTGMRQTYHVLSDQQKYYVMSMSRSKRDTGYFNLISKSAVTQLHRRLRGQQEVTAKLVHSRTRQRRQVPTTLAALNMLYVLVAKGDAKIDQRHHGRELYFNIKS